MNNLKISNLILYDPQIKIITTKSAKHFIDRSDKSVMVPILTDENEWEMWSKRDDPVLHIELGKWADIMLIAPLDANTLAKMATGVCDNLLLCTTRAWNFDKPLFFCPAMNTRMWEHPITEQQIATLKQWGHIEIKCIEKRLMCGDIGLGAMETPDNIVQTIVEFLNKFKQMSDLNN